MKNKLSEIQNEINYCKENKLIRTKDISDGYHTFGDLYHHRAVLFSMVCRLLKENSWKSKIHDDGTMFEGMFITGVSTPEGQYTYHYNMEYWDMYDVKELEKAPVYDGHKPEDIARLFSLLDMKQKQYGWYDYFDIVEQLFGMCETADDLTAKKDRLQEILIRHFMIAKDDLKENLH